MSLRLLIDNEDSQDKILVAKLKEAGHDVLTAKDAELLGHPDSEVLAYAVEDNRIVLTRNCNDFCAEVEALKAAGCSHHGAPGGCSLLAPGRKAVPEDETKIARAAGGYRRG